MKRGWAIVGVLLTGVILALFAWTRPVEDPSIAELLDENPPVLTQDSRGRGAIGVRRPVATASEPSRPSGPLMRIRVIDASTADPVAGARMFSAYDGAVLARTDDAGFAELVAPSLNAIVFGAAGYLTEHFFNRDERVRGMLDAVKRRGYVEVLLEPDALTIPCTFRFTGVGGRPAVGVRVRLTCRESPPPSAGTVPTDRMPGGMVPPELRAAWQRHALLSTIQRPDFNPELLHFGVQSHREEFLCGATATVRFLASGRYFLEAGTKDGFCRREIDVRLDGPPISVQLEAGRSLFGRVTGADDQVAVVGAYVEVTRAKKIVTTGETDSQGRFALGPMSTDPVHLVIRHPAYAAQEREGVIPDDSENVYVLKMLPKFRVCGKVCRRPDRRPVAGSLVKLVSGMGTAVEGRTDSEGRFDLRSHLIEPTIEIEAKGFLSYSEMLNAHGDAMQFDLIPATAEARRRAGLTAILFGRVLDAKQQPVVHCPVEVRPVAEGGGPRRAGIDGRRIIRGGIVPFQQMVISGKDGCFTIEWPQSEGVRVTAVGGGAPVTGGERQVSVVLGRRHEVILRANSRR